MKNDRSQPANEGLGPKPGESLGAWENKVLGSIFRLTLDSALSQDSHGNKLHYVGSVRADLEDQKEAITLSTAVLDQAILEAASKAEKTTPLDYLLGCWKRVSRQYRSLKGTKTEDPRLEIVKEARRLCMSYCMFAVSMPDMFG